MKKTDALKEATSLQNAHSSTYSIFLKREALAFTQAQIEGEQIRLKSVLRELARRHKLNASRIKGLDAVVTKR